MSFWIDALLVVAVSNGQRSKFILIVQSFSYSTKLIIITLFFFEVLAKLSFVIRFLCPYTK